MQEAVADEEVYVVLPDAVTDGNKRDAVLANAPEKFDGFYLVPKVVE